MDDTFVFRPIFVKTRKFLVQEIASLEDGIDFLLEWPEEDQDLIHATALRTCYEASDGLKPLPVARDAIRGFARKKGILENPVAAMSWLKTSSNSSGHAPA